jgi:hypothetical protein
VQRGSWPFLVYVVIKLGCENDGHALYRMVDPAFLKGVLNRLDESFSSNANDARGVFTSDRFVSKTVAPFAFVSQSRRLWQGPQ